MPRVVVLGASTTDMNMRLGELPKAGETRLGSGFFMAPGGKGANQAIAARRAGAEVLFLTAFGDDDLSRNVMEHDRAEGIDLTYAKIIVGGFCGVALILVDDQGRNLIGIDPGANFQLTPADIDALPPSVFARGSILLASLEVPIPVVVRAVQRARRAGMTVVLNPAPAVDRDLLAEILPLVDILTPNDDETRQLIPPTVVTATHRKLEDLPAQESWRETLVYAEMLVRHGSPRVLVTLGEHGCAIVQADSVGVHLVFMIPGIQVDVVDTVGAGDAFNGAFAAALAEGKTVLGAACWANAAAALSVQKPGAQGGLAHRSAIEQMHIDHPTPGYDLT